MRWAHLGRQLGCWDFKPKISQIRRTKVRSESSPAGWSLTWPIGHPLRRKRGQWLRAGFSCDQTTNYCKRASTAVAAWMLQRRRFYQNWTTFCSLGGCRKRLWRLFSLFLASACGKSRVKRCSSACHIAKVPPFAPIGSVALLHAAFADNGEIWWAHIQCNRQNIDPITLKVFFERLFLF